MDRPRATQLLADDLKTAQELGMNQLCDQVIATQASLAPDPALPRSQLDSCPDDSAAVFRHEGNTGPLASNGSSSD